MENQTNPTGPDQEKTKENTGSEPASSQTSALKQRISDSVGSLPTAEAASQAAQEETARSAEQSLTKSTSIPQSESPSLELTVYQQDVTGRIKGKSSATLRNIRSLADLSIIERAMLVKADPCSKWCDFELPTIVNAILFSESLGLSFEQGDVYTTAKPNTKGNFSYTAKARIKMANQRVRFSKPPLFEWEIGAPIKIPWKTWQASGIWEGTNDTLRVRLFVEGWEDPLVYEAKLAEWFDGANPNWVKRSRFMLQQNAFGHACELVRPGATTEEEAP